jgi:hypothetical protein
MIGGIRDPYIMQRLDTWLAEVKHYIYRAVEGNLGDGDMHGGQQFIPLMDIEVP